MVPSDCSLSASETEPAVPTSAEPVCAASMMEQALAFAPLLHRILYRITRGSSEVPDLVQETYCRLLAWKGQKDSADVRGVKAFVTHAATNVGIDWLRQRGTSHVDFVSEPDTFQVADWNADIESTVGSELELERLAHVVGSLPAGCRRVFMLRKAYGFSQAETAEHLGIAEHTVEVHMGKAARLIGDSLYNKTVPYTGATLLNPFSRRIRPAKPREYGIDTVDDPD